MKLSPKAKRLLACVIVIACGVIAGMAGDANTTWSGVPEPIFGWILAGAGFVGLFIKGPNETQAT
jgi:hypothetical protein